MAYQEYANTDEHDGEAWFCELDAGAPVILDRQAELETIRRAKGGDEMAKDKLIRSQLRWIIQLARGVRRPAGMGVDELISVGAYELIRCLAKFDEARGLRLSTFCERSIRGAMWREVHANDGTIRIPSYVPERKKARQLLAVRGFGEAVTFHAGGRGQRVFTSTLGDYLDRTIPDGKDEAGQKRSAAREALMQLRDAAGLTSQERRAFTLVFLAGEQEDYTYAGRKMRLSRESVRLHVARAWAKIQAHVGAEATPVPYQTHRTMTPRKGKGAA